MEDVVAGDIVLLNAGDAIPADCLILESRELFVDEATMTGKTYPVEKEVSLYTFGPIIRVSLTATIFSPDSRAHHDPVYLHGGRGEEDFLSALESLKLLRF